MAGGLQRVVVVSTSAPDAEVDALRADSPMTLCAPTAEAKRVVQRLALDPRPETLLAPVRLADGHRSQALERLVRTHASADRFRDVVVICDPDTARLVIKVIGDSATPVLPVTELGLPRGERPPQPVWWGLVGALVLAIVSGLLSTVLHPLALPLLVALAGGVLWLSPARRPLARTLLLVAGVGALLLLLGITSARRFPAG